MPPREEAYDQLFKEMLKAFFGEFLEIVAPHIAAQLDTSKAEHLDKETFTDLPKGRHRYLDLLVKVPRKKSKAGEAELVLAHTEVEGDFGEPIDKRMWRYFMQLKLRHDLPVLPIVIFVNGGQPDIQRRDVKDSTCGFEMNCFSYLSFGLSPSSAQDYLKKPGALAAALAVHMKRGSLSKAKLKAESLAQISKAKLGEAKNFLAVNFVQTYLPLEEAEREEYTKLLEKSPYQEVKNMETWADKIRNEGKAEGKAEGKTEGKAEAKREWLQKILAMRQLSLSQDQREALQACAETAKLDLWLERALTASSTDEIFGKPSTKTKKR